jgi:5-methylcytosine-specific restriction endonuclease McrA
MGLRRRATLLACLDCGTITSNGNRCTTHQRQADKRHNAARPDLHTTAYTRLARAAITSHINAHGLWCPGDPHRNHTSHPVDKRSDLTIDHIKPAASGHSPLDQSNYRVLCRSANSSKGAAYLTTVPMNNNTPSIRGGAPCVASEA